MEGWRSLQRFRVRQGEIDVVNILGESNYLGIELSFATCTQGHRKIDVFFMEGWRSFQRFRVRQGEIDVVNILGESDRSGIELSFTGCTRGHRKPQWSKFKKVAKQHHRADHNHRKGQGLYVASHYF